MKLQINNRSKTRKFTKLWKINNTLLINGSKKKSQEKLENTFRQMKTKNTHTKTDGIQQKQCSEDNL